MKRRFLCTVCLLSCSSIGGGLAFHSSSSSILKRSIASSQSHKQASLLNQVWDTLSVRRPTGLPSNNNDASSLMIIQEFVTCWNDQTIFDKLPQLFAQDAEWEDFSFSTVCQGRDAIERRLRLMQTAAAAAQWSMLVLDTTSIVATSEQVAFQFRFQESQIKGCAFIKLNDTLDRITHMEWITEPTKKGGEASLKTLSLVSKVLRIGNNNKPELKSIADPSASKDSDRFAAVPKRYFEAWNRRDMTRAVSFFADDVTYDDTAFPVPFTGKDNLRAHLLICADAFPASFTFEVDNVIADKQTVAVKWHVENNGKPLPFTRGRSFYKLSKSAKIVDGIDFVEAAGPVKPGGVALLLDTMGNYLKQEPARLIPIAVWLAYMYIVFLSDGILPGANALVLERRTWEEVINLSLNFFFVAPLLHLPFSPVVHPMLEGVFNLLLSWAAMFAGFLSDERRNKPNLLPMLPMVAGMQFLTSAFLLPFLATRSTEMQGPVAKDELGAIARAFESPLIGLSMGVVGSGSLAWFFFGRMAEFGDLSQRWSTFVDLLSIDRVGSSFLVDLAIFAMFQGWLIDDDMKRRGGEASPNLIAAAKVIPFFGMAAYLTLRPSLPTTKG